MYNELSKNHHKLASLTRSENRSNPYKIQSSMCKSLIKWEIIDFSCNVHRQFRMVSPLHKWMEMWLGLIGVSRRSKFVSILLIQIYGKINCTYLSEALILTYDMMWHFVSKSNTRNEILGHFIIKLTHCYNGFCSEIGGTPWMLNNGIPFPADHKLYRGFTRCHCAQSLLSQNMIKMIPFAPSTSSYKKKVCFLHIMNWGCKVINSNYCNFQLLKITLIFMQQVSVRRN